MVESYHLKKSSTTGHLLRELVAGHLVNQCLPPVDVCGCNGCDPPLAAAYVVVLDGLGGWLDGLNGSHIVSTLVCSEDPLLPCEWRVDYPPEESPPRCRDPGVKLQWIWRDRPDPWGPIITRYEWYVSCGCQHGCNKFWRRQVVPPAPCEPLGNYSPQACYDSGCPSNDCPNPPPPDAECYFLFGGTCGLSTAGTCRVEAVP